MESPDRDVALTPSVPPAIERNLQPWLLLSLAIVLAIGALIYFCAPSQLAMIDESSELDRCVQRLVPTVRSGNLDTKVLAAATGYCAQHRYYGDWLGDWQVRRTSFALQQYNGKIMLAMVVSLTLAGVFLAAVQLSTALKLASASGMVEAGGKLVLEPGKLSLSSSVTGLIILALSFAFFSVYAIYVYPLRPITVDPAPLMPAVPKEVPAVAPSEAKPLAQAPAPAPTVYASGGFGSADSQSLLPKKSTRPRVAASHARLLATPSTLTACTPETGPASPSSRRASP